MSGAYYNEFDPKAAAWLRELIRQGHIADGDVDERNLWDVRPDDIRGYTQVHLCAGVGVWSHALRLAGWPDGRPVWTGSFPCQPFSAAGKRGGLADERHLWPAGHWLARELRPGVFFGEQVASKDAEPWLDLVQADVEGMGHAFGACAYPAAGVGAPHIRDRTYWVADANDARSQGWGGMPERADQRLAGAFGVVGGVADAKGSGWREERANGRGRPAGDRAQGQPARPGASGGDLWPGPINGRWRDADWLLCRDGRWRPVEASAQPMADGSANSLGRVRDSIVAELQEEINAWSMETEVTPAEGLRALRRSLTEATPREWTVGGLPGLYEAPFLLAFMRQLAEQGWYVAEGVPLSCPEAQRARVRMLRNDLATASASRQRELAGQLPGKHPDALHLLSSLLARRAHSAWSDTYSAYAEVGFPLGVNSPARVGRLRGYGNAIVVAAAVAWIESYLEAKGEIIEATNTTTQRDLAA